MAESKTAEGSIERRLQDLLAYPRESLGTELKGWLDLSKESDKANLAQAMIALANYGGGYIIIGFAEDGGKWIASEHRPENLDIYNQDIINGIVQAYAEPPFHCSVYHLKNPTNDLIYPIIVVPGEIKAPVRAKKDGPNREHVRQFAYYIRRPGPKSEPPQSAQEWDELIGRCVRAAKQDLLDDIRSILLGLGTSAQIPNPEEERSKKFALWIQDSRSRWEALVAQKLSAEQPSRYSHGIWTAAYSIEANIDPPALASFLDTLKKAQGYETGWPVWLILGGANTSPYPYNGLIECWLAEGRLGGPAHSDFWRASPSGMMFLLRGYQEDEDPSMAGKIFDLTIPVWRVGECLLHAERLAKMLGVNSAPIAFQISWSGLSNRLLKSWANPMRMMWGDYRARQDSFTANIRVPSDHISTHLPELVSSLTRGLYESFDFFVPPPKMVEEELSMMRGGKVS
ncbi:MAG: ATP-binding protein [Candidatus Bathyarchaeota archaeon]|nr:ATP-binding protein [Candidatus Bathyarchaeota archaeon]